MSLAELKKLGAHEIHHSELVFKEKVGEGSFGVVKRAHWRGMEVAVKELKLVSVRVWVRKLCVAVALALVHP